METEEAAGLKKSTSLWNRLYNFFARHFTTQGNKLVTLGGRWGDQGGATARAPRRGVAEEAAAGDFFYPMAIIPVGDAPGSLGATAAGGGGQATIGRIVSIGGREDEGETQGSRSNINERCDKFIRSRKEALKSESSLRRRPSGQ